MADSGLVPQPLRSYGSFNWVYLIEYLVMSVLSLFFLFYFNRFIATVTAWAIRLYTWHRLRIYVEIQALQVSPLAGRIFFKGIRYHGDNETIFIHEGYITWRYWLRNVKKCELFEGRTPHLATTATWASSSTSGDSSPGLASNIEKGGHEIQKTLPCRISVKLSGLEVFLYNRSPAYDWIMDSIIESDTSNPRAEQQTHFAQHSERTGYHDLHRRKTNYSNSDSLAQNPSAGLATVTTSTDKSNRTQSLDTAGSSDSTKPKKRSPDGSYLNTDNHKVHPPSILRLLPVRIECKTGAVVLGNENTKTIITAKFDTASGEVDASSPGPLDVFKLLIKAEVARPYVQMRPNVDYKTPQLSEAASLKNLGRAKHDKVGTHDEAEFKAAQHNFMQRFSHILHWSRLSRLVLRTKESLESVTMRPGYHDEKNDLPGLRANVPGQGKWVGLSRYLEDQYDEHDEWNAIEYGKCSVLADVDQVDFTFFWDIPGSVLSESNHMQYAGACLTEDINGTEPPEYGLHLSISGGRVNYGPWADRHRVNLQQIFFPAQYTNAVPARMLKVGETRVCTKFKLRVTVTEDTVLRIPFREPSKDWKWKGRAAAVSGRNRAKHTSKHKGHRIPKKKTSKSSRDKGTIGADVRPFAWFDIKVASGTIINYKMDMVPQSTGYRNLLEADVSAITISSSLNHGLLWRSRQVTMTCDLSNPLSWNGLREWTFNIDIWKLDFFLLRDHTFLLVDMIEDWSSGPVQDFYTFAPYRYLLNITFHEFKLFLNTNDANIVNKPDDLDDNNFIILYGRKLDADLIIPLDRLRPSSNEISFNVTGLDLGFQMCMPPKNTLQTLLLNKDVAQLNSVHLIGVYANCSEVRPGLTETLHLDINGKGLRISMYGFFARHLAKIKENYFGDDVHFRTTDEYQEFLNNGMRDGTSTQPPVKSNDLDVILDITAEDASIVLPAALYNDNEHVLLKLHRADVDLRVTNYYLELMLNSSPLELCYTGADTCNGVAAYQTSSTQLFIDSVKVFGHRFFGLPPAEPAYLSHWDIDVGSIAGECASAFVQKCIQAGQNFALKINDYENAAPIPHAGTVHDATFVRFQCPEIRIWCDVDQEALLLTTRGVSGSFNDLAGSLFSQKLNLMVPHVSIACCDGETTSRRRHREHESARTYAYIETMLSFKMVQRNFNFEADRQSQQAHLQIHDQQPYRADFLFQDLKSPTEAAVASQKRPSAPSIPLPSIPSPIKCSARIKPADGLRAQPIIQGNDVVAQQVDVDTSHFHRRSPINAAGISTVDSLHLPTINGETAYSRSSIASATTTSLRDQSEPADLDEDVSNEKRQIPETLSSSIAFSSPFNIPHFRLRSIEPDLENVPHMPKYSQESREPQQPLILPNEQLDLSSNEDASHTSFLINMAPGIVAYCQPRAIHCMANLIEHLTPKDPDSVLDTFHINVMSKTISDLTKQKGTNSVLDLSVTIPSIHLKFSNTHSIEKMKSNTLTDVYDLTCNNLTFIARAKAMEENSDEGDSKSLYASVGSIHLCAQERSSHKENDDVAFEAAIDDILIWLTDGERTSIRTSFRLAKISTASRKVDYLASLIHRTAMLVKEFENRFRAIAAASTRRLRYLVYKLTMLEGQIADPIFLTQPSYTLRSTRDHLRANESWKVISRLRNILQCMPQAEKTVLTLECMDHIINYPENAELFVIRTIDNWRNTDSLDVRESLLVRFLFGSIAGVEKLYDRSRVPVEVVIRAGAIKLLVDPGSRQTEFSMSQLSVRLSITPSPPPAALSVFQEHSDLKTTVLQVHVATISLALKWEILELVDQLLTLFEQTATNDIQMPSNFAAPANTEQNEKENETFHIVFGSDSTTMDMETLNLRQSIASDNLKISVTGRGWTPDSVEKSVNAILSADATLMETTGKQRQLFRAKFMNPTIWIAYDQYRNDSDVEERLKLAGAGTEIILDIREEILGVVEILDAVLDDEVIYARRLFSTHSVKNLLPASPNGDSAKIQSVFKLELALFLDYYNIRVAILHDLIYSTEGRAIRLSISPVDELDMSFQIDYDLLEQSHEILKSFQHGGRSSHPLKMPPINGTISLNIAATVISASAASTIEMIQFDGQAMYGMLSNLSTSRVASAASAIKADGISLMEKVDDIFPELISKSHQSPPTASRPIVFDANFVLVGFSISAEAPAKVRGTKPATLTFNLGPTQVRAANRSLIEDKALPFPEIRLDVKRMSIDLEQPNRHGPQPCGSAEFSVLFTCTVEPSTNGRKARRDFKLSAIGPSVNIFAETAPVIVEIFAHLQEKFKDLDLSKEKAYIRRLSRSHKRIDSHNSSTVVSDDGMEFQVQKGFISTFSLDLQAIELGYSIGNSISNPVSRAPEDLVLTLKSITLLTRSESEARLSIKQVQLQMVSPNQSRNKRSMNSALLPEVIFKVNHESSKRDRKLHFRAAGKALDIQLEPHFILPAKDLEKSLTLSSQKLRFAVKALQTAPVTGGFPSKDILGNRKLSKLIVDADFAGAVISLQGHHKGNVRKGQAATLHLGQIPQHGRYGQFSGDTSGINATLHAPGVAFRIQYEDKDHHDASLNIEVRVDGSNNVLHPTVVPLILQISDSIKQVVSKAHPATENLKREEPLEPAVKPSSKTTEDDSLIQADPRAILGKTRLNLGFRICKQEFALSCQPIAKVEAKMEVEDIYITVNTVDSRENGNFFAVSANFAGLRASLQHLYSRDPTFTFDIDSIVLSFMNSKHLSGKSGISAILRINPTRTQINAKQLQEVLLFREIWLPPEIRHAPEQEKRTLNTEQQDYFVHRYHQVAAATSFPWNASVAIANLSIDLDLGQTIGKVSFGITNFWASSKKTTSAQQNLCVGIDDVSISSAGRMSGFVELQKVKVRTSIAWPSDGKNERLQTPLIQGSIGFDQLRVKAAFDYHAFAVAEITSFEFIMYNVRDRQKLVGDRLVAILDGDKVKVYAISASAALGLSLFQAFERLVQEKKTSYEESLRDIEKFLYRRSNVHEATKLDSTEAIATHENEIKEAKMPISLHTDVVVTLRSIDVGAFPNTLFDHQLLHVEASDIQARFAVALEQEMASDIQSSLGLTLGQLRVALATIPNTHLPKTLGEITIEEIINNATSSKGGVILRVPRVVASMQTWQAQDSNLIDYIFKSSFEGKIDVGWNYSRISFIRGMWATHSRTLATRLGKPLPESALKINTVPRSPTDEISSSDRVQSQDKITAVVNLPQSRYTYRARQPPIIETPQLRDMGEATPPLEWIGLQRDRLPNVTHQIVIVTLLEIAKEVEDAYTRVLGSG